MRKLKSNSCAREIFSRWTVYNRDSRRKHNDVGVVHPLPVPHPANISLLIHKREMQSDENIGGSAEQLDLDDAALNEIVDQLMSNDTITFDQR